MIKNLEYNTPYLHHVNLNSNNLEETYLLKTSVKAQNQAATDNYYLKIYLKKPNGDQILEGYLYFTIDFETASSNFIGVWINPLYRNLGLASFLIANWIDLMFNNDITNLALTKTQKKPFLLYLLKKFAFEIADISLYETKKSVIFICRIKDSNAKGLYFRSPFYQANFENGRIIKKDNYVILNEIGEDVEVLAPILLNHEYCLAKENTSKCYQKVIEVFKKH